MEKHAGSGPFKKRICFKSSLENNHYYDVINVNNTL